MKRFDDYYEDEYDKDSLLDEMPSIKGAIQEYMKDKEEYGNNEGYCGFPRRKQKYDFPLSYL